MEHFSEDQVKAIEANYKPTTLRNMWYLVRSIRKNIEFDMFTELKDKTEKVKENVFNSDEMSVGVKSNYIFAVIKLLKLCGIEPDEELEKMGREIAKQKKKYQSKKREERVIQKKFDVNSLYEFVKDVYDGDILSMFTILRCCPIRITEFCGMSTIDTGDNNYIDLKNGKIIVRQHKTKGERVVKLDKTALEDLKGCETIFEGMTEKQVQDKFSTVIRYYKKVKNIPSNITIGIHELRAQCEMQNMSVLRPGMSSEELEKMIERSKELGHSLETALKYYTAPSVLKTDKVVEKLAKEPVEDVVDEVSEDDSEDSLTEEEINIVRIINHKGDIDDPEEICVEYEDGVIGWIKISEISNFWSIAELVTKYKSECNYN